jgi:hypothetical protein
VKKIIFLVSVEKSEKTCHVRKKTMSSMEGKGQKRRKKTGILNLLQVLGEDQDAPTMSVGKLLQKQQRDGHLLQNEEQSAQVVATGGGGGSIFIEETSVTSERLWLVLIARDLPGKSDMSKIGMKVLRMFQDIFQVKIEHTLNLYTRQNDEVSEAEQVKRWLNTTVRSQMRQALSGERNSVPPPLLWFHSIGIREFPVNVLLHSVDDEEQSLKFSDLVNLWESITAGCFLPRLVIFRDTPDQWNFGLSYMYRNVKTTRKTFEAKINTDLDILVFSHTAATQAEEETLQSAAKRSRLLQKQEEEITENCFGAVDRCHDGVLSHALTAALRETEYSLNISTLLRKMNLLGKGHSPRMVPIVESCRPMNEVVPFSSKMNDTPFLVAATVSVSQNHNHHTPSAK